RGVEAKTALIDGEVVAIDAKGCPSFQALQNRASSGRGWQIVYYAFDLLSLGGDDWTKRSLCERKEKLFEIVNGSDVRYNAELDGSPDAIIRTIKTAGLAGGIVKQRDSVYRAGTRVATWLKIKVNKAQELVIGGCNTCLGIYKC